MPTNNTVDYLEIPSRDLAATKAFFAGLFNWSFKDYGDDYTCFDDGHINGGFWKADQISSATTAPLIVFYHSDLSAQMQRVKELGGTITRDIFSFPGGRRFHFTEPGGGEFGIWSE